MARQESTDRAAPCAVEGYVKANGLNIYYQQQGDGLPLLLFHGGMSNGQQTWGPYIPGLSKSFSVFLPDTRGHGRTDNPTGQFSWRLMAEDMIAFMQALDIKKPLVGGYSDGAQMAFEIGVNYPDFAQALVLGAGPGYKFLGTAASTAKFKQILGMPNTDRLTIDKTEIDQIRPNFATAWRTAHEYSNGPDYWKELLQQIWPIYSTPSGYSADSFKKVIAPTLILVGDRDEFLPVGEAVEMYCLIRQAELAVLPNANHFLLRTKKELFAQTMTDFLHRHKGV